MGAIKSSKSNIKPEPLSPLIISASRATDIPAFQGDWFIERLREGFVDKVNPYNQNPIRIEFSRARAVVFWTKNPAPFLIHLREIIDLRLTPVFLFTLNNYEPEGWESRLPPLEQRLETFIRLAQLLPPGSVAWRFDPIALSAALGPEEILSRIEGLWGQLTFFTEKLIFSFVDIYPKIARRLGSRLDLRPPGPEEKKIILKGLGKLNARSPGGPRVCACASGENLGLYGLKTGSCVDAHLLARLCPELNNHPELFYRPQTGPLFNQPAPRKDKGQRQHCQCAPSRDIGSYNTCAHGCLYCYANR